MEKKISNYPTEHFVQQKKPQTSKNKIIVAAAEPEFLETEPQFVQ